MNFAIDIIVVHNLNKLCVHATSHKHIYNKLGAPIKTAAKIGAIGTWTIVAFAIL